MIRGLGPSRFIVDTWRKAIGVVSRIDAVNAVGPRSIGHSDRPTYIKGKGNI
jgi:hypothetical protein